MDNTEILMQAGNKDYKAVENLPKTVPVFPLTGVLLLPGGQLPLNIFEPRYIDMIDDAMQSDKVIGMVQPSFNRSGDGSADPQLCEIGCLGRITTFQETGDGRYLISLAGVCRFSIAQEIAANTAYRQCEVVYDAADLIEHHDEDSIDRGRLLEAFRKFLDTRGMEADWDTINDTDTETLLTALCMMCPFDPPEKQALLEAPTLADRAEILVTAAEMLLASETYTSGQNLQ